MTDPDAAYQEGTSSDDLEAAMMLVTVGLATSTDRDGPNHVPLKGPVRSSVRSLAMTEKARIPALERVVAEASR